MGKKQKQKLGKGLQDIYVSENYHKRRTGSRLVTFSWTEKKGGGGRNTFVFALFSFKNTFEGYVKNNKSGCLRAGGMGTGWWRQSWSKSFHSLHV